MYMFAFRHCCVDVPDAAAATQRVYAQFYAHAAAANVEMSVFVFVYGVHLRWCICVCVFYSHGRC